jgi:tRNA(Ile)-lysidine synthase TilS/MesJ
MKCTVCRGPAVIDIRRHNGNFCAEHFLRLCRDQVAKAVKDHDMLAPGDRVLVAVSGGKDSLALWDILLDLGYDVDGLYIGLGIGEYSDESGQYARAFAASRDARLVEIDLRAAYGYDIPTGARAARRAPCSACGLTKRHLFDQAAVEGKYDVVATGHNLDDEAAVLFGNVLHWHTDYLGRQAPVLPARGGFPKKVKPLVRLGEREMAAYCVIRGIDYIVEECPMAEGNRHLRYKDALNDIEVASPGAKFDFYHGFLARAADRFGGGHAADDAGDDAGDGAAADGSAVGTDELGRCERCGAPCSGDVCAFCRLVERAAGAAPVTLTRKSRRAS